jgi:hypothetical protein
MNLLGQTLQLQQNDEYCQMLIKRIEAETKQEAKRQARLIKLAGHLGIAKTIVRIKRKFNWKGVKKDESPT